MLKRAFFIIIVLFLSLFEVVKAEEPLKDCSSIPKQDCTLEVIELKDSSADDFIKPLNLKINKNNELTNPVTNNVGNGLDNDNIKLVSSQSGVTLGIFSPLLTKSDKGGGLDLMLLLRMCHCTMVQG